MKQLIELTLISHDTKDSFLVEWISVESPSGSFVVSYNHEPVISALENQSELKYKKQNETLAELNIKGGVFILQDNQATVLLD